MTAHETALAKMAKILENNERAKEVQWPEPMTPEAEQQRRDFLAEQVRQWEQQQ